MSLVVIEKIFSQIIFWTITVMVINVAWLFYKSRDGRLRLLIIELFLSLGWLFGIAGLYYLLWDFGCFQNWNLIWLRIVCNLPLFTVIIRLRDYIINKK